MSFSQACDQLLAAVFRGDKRNTSRYIKAVLAEADIEVNINRLEEVLIVLDDAGIAVPAKLVVLFRKDCEKSLPSWEQRRDEILHLIADVQGLIAALDHQLGDPKYEDSYPRLQFDKQNVSKHLVSWQQDLLEVEDRIEVYKQKLAKWPI
jgi:hypothetical protein